METDLKKNILFLISLALPLILTSCFSPGNNYDPIQNPYGNQPGGAYQQGGQYYGYPPQQQQGGYGAPQNPYGRQQPPSGYYNQQPASRYYSNPYALPPQGRYPYYDGDQYYVPPTYYGTPDSTTSYSNDISKF